MNVWKKLESFCKTGNCEWGTEGIKEQIVNYAKKIL